MSRCTLSCVLYSVFFICYVIGGSYGQHMIGTKIYWNKCFHKEQYSILARLSADQCLDECIISSRHCKAVAYERLSTVCRLYHDVDVMNVEKDTFTCVGSNIVYRNSFIKNEIDVCSGNSCAPKDCGPFLVVPSVHRVQQVLGNLATIGTKRLIVCENNIRITVTCLETGEWSHGELLCLANCSTPRGLDNGNMTYNGTTEGSRVEYMCNSPLKAKPTGVPLEYTCGADGQWSYHNTFLQCEVNCGHITTAQHAIPTATSEPWRGSIVTYTCDANYAMVPPITNNSIECMPDGQWSNITFTCQFNCGVPEVNYANASYNSTLVGAHVTYTCNDGYVLQPQDANTSRFCIEPTFWSLQNFTCLANCSEPRSIMNATKTFPSTLQGSIVNYSCIQPTVVFKPSYRLNFYCNELRQWSPIDEYNSVSCQLYCVQPPSKDNAWRHDTLEARVAYGQVKYNCHWNARFDTNPPNDTIVCQPTTTAVEWTQPNFNCIKITYNEPCSNDSDCLDKSSHCYPTNESNDITSQPNDSNRRCTCKPLYSFNQTTYTCEPISFGNGTFEPCSTDLDCSIANTRCVGNPNTNSVQSAVCACKPGFVRGNDMHTCKPVNCTHPPEIRNATVSLNSTSYGSLAQYTCINAEPRGEYGSQMQLRCLGEGSWYQQWWQSQRFSCLVKCNSPPELAHGNYTGTWRHHAYDSWRYSQNTMYYEGYEVQYICHTSSNLSTSASGDYRTTKCQLTGNWEPNAHCNL